MAELTTMRATALQSEMARADTASSDDVLHRVGVALSDPLRRKVLLVLAEGPAYPADLAEYCDTSRSNMSNHLSCLRGCGLIVSEREGRQIRYEIVSSEFAKALQTLAGVTLASTCHHP